MKAYLDIVRRVLETGERKKNRTGVDAITVAGAMFEHDMASGFPLLTTKRVPFKPVRVELEFFLKGFTDKRWLQERGCSIWDSWASPSKVPYGHDEATQAKMREEPDLGPIYGRQWRSFGAEYRGCDPDHLVYDHIMGPRRPRQYGVDQLANLVETLKRDPSDRRMIVSAWNPAQLHEMALPPCHYAFQVTVINGKLNLLWNQRSVDTMVGLPFNVASYGLLLHLLAKGAGLAEGKLVGFLADTHVYVNHVEGAQEQLRREPTRLPSLETISVSSKSSDFSIFDWTHTVTKAVGYDPAEEIKFTVAV